MIELVTKNNNLNYKQALKGDKGENGASAYEVAVNNGFIGSEQEWLLSLKGKDGEKGAKGDKGDTGATGATGADGAQGAKGEKGDKGDSGAPFTFDMFTPEQLQALKGEKGEKGDTGEAGASKPIVKCKSYFEDWVGFILYAAWNVEGVLEIVVCEEDRTFYDNKIIVEVSFIQSGIEYTLFSQAANGYINEDITITTPFKPYYWGSRGGCLVQRAINCKEGLYETLYNYEPHTITEVKVYYIEVNAE